VWTDAHQKYRGLMPTRNTVGLRPPEIPWAYAHQDDVEKKRKLSGTFLIANIPLHYSENTLLVNQKRVFTGEKPG
jgi:hypothetical protein